MLNQKTCKNCRYYHGYHDIHCAIYPLGISDFYCHDWRKVKIKDGLKPMNNFDYDEDSGYSAKKFLFMITPMFILVLFITGEDILSILSSPDFNKPECKIERNLNELGTTTQALPILRDWSDCLNKHQYLTAQDRKTLKLNIRSLDVEETKSLSHNLLSSFQSLESKYSQERLPPFLLLELIIRFTTFAIFVLMVYSYQ